MKIVEEALEEWSAFVIGIASLAHFMARVSEAPSRLKRAVRIYEKNERFD
jgi:hypothetical protein